MINIQTLINESVEKTNQVRGGQRDLSKFHVSDAGTCYRKRFMKRLGVEPKNEIAIGALRKMMAGDAGHEKLQGVLARHGSLMAAEGEIETPHIKGHFDAIIRDGDKKALVEFKTIEKWAMSYIKKDGPKPEHTIQMFTYWAFLRKDYKSLDQAILSYVKREDFEAKDFNFLWSEEISTLVAQEWLPLEKFWTNKVIPPCTCDKDYGGKGVQYCRYINEDGESCCSEELITKEMLDGIQVA